MVLERPGRKAYYANPIDVNVKDPLIHTLSWRGS